MALDRGIELRLMVAACGWAWEPDGIRMEWSNGGRA